MMIINTEERKHFSELFFVPATTRYSKKHQKTRYSLGVKHNKCEWSWFRRFTSKDEPYTVGEVFVDYYAKKYVLEDCVNESEGSN